MIIPGFTSTGSKRPEALFGSFPGPRQLVRAEGCTVWDADGRAYLDTTMALGAVALGYGHPEVVRAAERAMGDGGVGPLPPVLEHEVAERLVAIMPGAQAVRFFKSGAEAMAAAVRTARVYTGREHVVSCGYHGWLDWCQDTAGVPAAVRQLRRVVPFNDVVELRRAVDESGPIAAIVIEPVIDGPPDVEWLAEARRLASASGAVLVFDEIKTVLRIARGGAAERYGVVPDLVAIGKALGNGFPIAALLGSVDVMRAVTRTWISSTLATESVSLAAARAVLDVYEREGVIEHLERVGNQLERGLRSVARAHSQLVAAVRGVPQMCYLVLRTEGLACALASGLAQRGLLFKRNAYNFVSLAHSQAIMNRVLEDLDRTLDDMAQSC